MCACAHTHTHTHGKYLLRPTISWGWWSHPSGLSRREKWNNAKVSDCGSLPGFFRTEGARLAEKGTMRVKLHTWECSNRKLTDRWYSHWIFQFFKYSLVDKPMKCSYFKNVCYKLVSGHFQNFPPLAMEIWIWCNVQMRVKEKSWVQPLLTETVVWEKIIIKVLRHKYFWVKMSSDSNIVFT